MSISNAARDPPVPPALPPPQHPEIDDDVSIGQHKGWDWFNKEYVNQHWTDFGQRNAAVKPGSSLLGGKKVGLGVEGGEEKANLIDNEIDPARRGSSISTVTPAHGGYDSMSDINVSSDKEDASSKPLNYRCVTVPLSLICFWTLYANNGPIHRGPISYYGLRESAPLSLMQKNHRERTQLGMPPP